MIRKHYTMTDDLVGGGIPKQGEDKPAEGETTVICDDPGLWAVLENDRLNKAAADFVLDKFNGGVSPTTEEHCIDSFLAGAAYVSKFPTPNLAPIPKPQAKEEAQVEEQGKLWKEVEAAIYETVYGHLMPSKIEARTIVEALQSKYIIKRK